MLKWGLWDQLEPELIERAWARTLADKRGEMQNVAQFSPFWMLLSVGRQLFLSMAGKVDLTQTIDNLFLHAFMLGVNYARMEHERIAIDRFGDEGGADDSHEV